MTRLKLSSNPAAVERALRASADPEDHKKNYGPHPILNPCASYGLGSQRRPKRYVRIAGSKKLTADYKGSALTLHWRDHIWNPDMIGARVTIAPDGEGTVMMVRPTMPFELSVFPFGVTFGTLFLLIGLASWISYPGVVEGAACLLILSAIFYLAPFITWAVKWFSQGRSDYEALLSWLQQIAPQNSLRAITKSD